MPASSALDRVMGQAEEAARDYREPTTSNALVPQSSASTALASRADSSAPSLNSIMEAGGINVDQYLQLKYEGFKVSDPDGLFDSDIIATINMAEIVPIGQIRSTRNGSTEFYKTYNGFSTPAGENFESLTNRLKNTPDTTVTGPYSTAEIPFTTVEDITVPGKAGGTIPAGTRIGTTPPITGVKFLSSFLKAVAKAGLDPENAEVKVRLKHSPQANNKGNKWGVVEFELLGEVDVDE